MCDRACCSQNVCLLVANLSLLQNNVYHMYNNVGLYRVDAASANAFYSIIKCAHFNAFNFDDNKMRNKMRNMLF